MEDEHYLDFNWSDFVEKLFTNPPMDPFTLRMEMLDNVDQRKLSQMLGYMLITGAKMKYNKEIAHLLPQEIDTLQKYYRSIGFQVTHEVTVTDGGEGKGPINHFQISFQKCPYYYNNYNLPEKLI
jgi:hypothetical protein